MAGFLTPDDEGWVIVQVVPEWEVAVKVHEVDGVPQITSLRLEPRRRSIVAPAATPSEAVITHGRLRRLPLRHLADMAATGGELDRITAALFDQVKSWPQGRPRPEEHYREVADVYRQALAARRPPLKAIQDRWGIGRSMASRYVREARDRGLLGAPPVKPGIAGEQPVKAQKRVTKRGKSS